MEDINVSKSVKIEKLICRNSILNFMKNEK